MDASNEADTPVPSNRLIAALRLLRERMRVLLPARSILLIVGIASICYSQYLMEQRAPLGTPAPLAERWNAIYRLEIVNYDNVFLALPYLIAGALLCAFTALPASWTEGFINWASHWPARENIKSGFWSPSLLIGVLSFGYLLIQLGRHQFSPIYLVFWLFPIWIFTRAFWKLDRNAKVDLSLGISYSDLFWVAALMILGFSLSSFALQDIPMTIIPDEGNFWETARAIALSFIHPVFFDSGVYTFPVASSIFQGWMLRIFGVSFWGWRFASVIAGVAAVIPLYLLAKEWFGRQAAIAAGIMMTANPYFIAFSRMGYNNSQALFPVALCIYFFAVGARKGSYFYLWLAGLVAGFGFYTYSAAWMGLVALVLGVAYLFLRKEIQWKRALSVLGVILTGWAILFVPRVAYTGSGENSGGLVYKIFETSFVNTFYAKAYYGESDLLRTIPLAGLSDKDTWFYNPVIYGELLLRGAVRTILAIFDPHIIFEHFLVTGLAGIITPIFFLVGLAISLRHAKQLRFGLPLMWLVAGLIFLSIIGAFPPRHTHLVSVIPALALLSGMGLVAVTQSLTDLISTRFGALRTLIRNLLVVGVSLAIIYFGFQRYYQTMPRTYPPTFEDVASWLAWRVERPVNLIYLSETDKPHRVEYLVNSKVVSHSYRSSLTGEFSAETHLAKDKPTIIFIEIQENQEIDLIENPPAGFHRPVTYHYPNGQIIGYVMTNTDLDLQPKVGVKDGWNSLTNLPVRYVLLVLAVVAVLFGMLALKDAIGWPKRDILLEIGKAQPKENLADVLDDGEKPEFDFHLRIRIPARRRNPS